MALPVSEILELWFEGVSSLMMKQEWFNSNYDSIIIAKYKELVDNLHLIDIKCLTPIEKYVYIIVGDQFTRNIYRNTMEEKKNDTNSLLLALELINSNFDLTIPLNHRFFILLPLRHNKTSELLNIVCSRIKLYFEEYQNCKALIKFYNYTICDYTDMVDEIKIGRPLEYDDKFAAVLETNRDHIKDESLKINISNMAISLSGGVDSMVLLDLLKKTNQNVIAIHVEHADSEVEREFLEYYCHKNNVKLYYRTIHYVKRKDPSYAAIDRNAFEEETKKARFNLYKYVIIKENLIGICMGHHMGDIVENVFTNMIKGRSMDLMAMKPEQEMLGVKIYRPLLHYTKEMIYSYAHKNNIPYFLNTTPVWSCRGVLRDQMMPILKKQFGDFENNIIKFAESYSSMVENNKVVSFERTDCYYGTVIKGDINKSDLKELVMDIMHKNKYHMISNKSCDELYKWLQTNKIKQKDISGDMFCYYTNNKLYFINFTLIKGSKDRMKCLYEMFNDNKLPPKILLLFKH